MFYKIIRFIASILIKLLFFVKFNNKKMLNDNYAKGGCIVAANHISLFDPVIIACALKRPIHYMAKAELFRKKFSSWFLKNLNAFPVDRSKADINAVKTALSLLKNNHILGIFPQGKRVAPNESQDAKLGAVQFAFKTKCPIIPVGIHTKGGKVGLFKRITVSFGEPVFLEKIGISDSKPESLHRARDYIMDKINILAENKNE